MDSNSLNDMCMFAWCPEVGYGTDEMGVKCKGHYEEHQASLAGVPWNREYEPIMCTNDWCDPDGSGEPHFNKYWCKKRYYFGEKRWEDFWHNDCKGKEECKGHICTACHDPFFKDTKCIRHSKQWFRKHEEDK